MVFPYEFKVAVIFSSSVEFVFGVSKFVVSIVFIDHYDVVYCKQKKRKFVV